MLSNQKKSPRSHSQKNWSPPEWLGENDEQHTSRKWNNGRSADFHRTCLWFCHGPLPRLPGADTNPEAVSADLRGTTQGNADQASNGRRIDRTLKPIHRLFGPSGTFGRSACCG